MMTREAQMIQAMDQARQVALTAVPRPLALTIAATPMEAQAQPHIHQKLCHTAKLQPMEQVQLKELRVMEARAAQVEDTHHYRAPMEPHLWQPRAHMEVHHLTEVNHQCQAMEHHRHRPDMEPQAAAMDLTQAHTILAA